FNVHATFARKLKEKTTLVQMAKIMKEDPEHSFQVLQELDPAVVKKYDELYSSGRTFTIIAGNDAHQNVKPFGLQLDPYPRAFKFVSTHVLAEELTEEAVLGALKRRRSYVAFDISRPIRMGDGDPKVDTEGVSSRIAVLGQEPVDSEGTGRLETRLPQRQEWWLPRDGGKAPWVLFPYR